MSHSPKPLLSHQAISVFPPTCLQAVTGYSTSNFWPNITLVGVFKSSRTSLFVLSKPENPPSHNCSEILDHFLIPFLIYSLTLPTHPSTSMWFLSGSSTETQGAIQSGCAIVTSDSTTELDPQPPGTISQAEHIALTRTLTLAKGLPVIIYIDSQYAFYIIHSHGPIWRKKFPSSQVSCKIVTGCLFTLRATILQSKRYQELNCH